MADARATDQKTLFGHPAGLYTLFFAEMWERFSYYGMRALLLFYMLKGFLQYSDPRGYAVYGAYTALVYMTPFFGGMLADRLLGARRAVVLGGLLMATGHLVMALQTDIAFFTALALLICGNGFFKPNISTIVGSLYPAGSPRRDGGFTLFYMGINLGAAMSPLLCGYIGETYGWHYGFGLASLGMLTGLAVFVAPPASRRSSSRSARSAPSPPSSFFGRTTPIRSPSICSSGSRCSSPQASPAWRSGGAASPPRRVRRPSRAAALATSRLAPAG